MSEVHDCVERLEESLVEHNTKLAASICFSNPERELIQITTVKADSSKRMKPANLYASFCPFCGIKLKGC